MLQVKLGYFVLFLFLFNLLLYKIVFQSFLLHLGHPIQVVTFQPMQGQLTQQATIKVTFDDDDIALEDNEIIGFSLSDPQGSILSPMSTTIDVVVMDDDGMFNSSIYMYASFHYMGGILPSY